jgi:hypothetical protein
MGVHDRLEKADVGGLQVRIHFLLSPPTLPALMGVHDCLEKAGVGGLQARSMFLIFLPYCTHVMARRAGEGGLGRAAGARARLPLPATHVMAW